METPKPLSSEVAALRAIKEDARIVLEWLNGPAFERFKECQKEIYERYHRILHAPNIDMQKRQEAAVAVLVASEFIDIKNRFTLQLRNAESRLAAIERESQENPNLWERIMTFGR